MSRESVSSSSRSIRRLVAAVAAVAVAVVFVASACSKADPAAQAEPTDGAAEGAAADGDAAAAGAEPDFAEVDEAVDQFVAERELNGAGLVIVDREDGVVHEHYAGEFGPDRISLVASSSKMITAGVLVHLADEGLLDLDAPVAQSVDWGDGNPTITPAQLISNSSGLVGLIDEPAYPPYLCQYVASGDLEDCGRLIFTTELDDADVVPPDTRFRYGGGQWQVAGALAEAVTGRSWADLIRTTYVEPCGVESLGYNNHYAQRQARGEGGGPANPFAYPPGVDGDPGVLTPTDNPNMEGGAYITAPDYAALLLMHLRGGRCGDTQVLSAEGVDRMHTDRVGPAYGGKDAQDKTRAYGLGWWVDEDDPAIVRDGGAFGAVPWLDLEDGYGAYLVVEATNDVGSALADELEPLVEQQLGTR